MNPLNVPVTYARRWVSIPIVLALTLAVSVVNVAAPSTAQAESLPDVSVQVVDVNVGTGFSNPNWLIDLNGRLYFSATDGCVAPDKVGRELWSVGPAGDLRLVKNINTAISGNCDGVTGFDVAALPSAIVFRARDNPFSSTEKGLEPWVSNGTEDGTALLKDIAVGDNFSFPQGFTTVMDGTLVVFSAEQPSDGFEPEPWITDGTTAGTRRVADLAPGEYGSFPEQFTPLSSTQFVFVADDYPAMDDHRGALWVSDGSSVELVADIDPDQFEEIDEIASFVGKDLVILAADDGTTGIEPWVSDGTAAGTFRLADINPSGSSSPRSFIQVGDQMFFSASAPDSGRELWVTDGTEAGTRLVKDLVPGTGSGYGGNGGAFKDKLYFQGPGTDLWVSDGTEGGTTPTGINDLPFFEPTVVGDVLFFSSAGPALWMTDGTPEGTVMVADGFTTSPRMLTAVGSSMLGFIGRDDAHGTEVWIAQSQDVFGPVVGIGFGPVPIGVFENGTLTATANDENTGGSNIAGIEFQIDGGAWGPMPPLDGAYDSVLETGIQSVSFATEGTHQACVRATDVAGNTGDVLCMDIEVVAGDSTPPVITQFDVQPNPVAVGETAVLSVQASDATSGDSQIVIIEYRVDGGPWTSIIPPADGFYDESVEEGEVDLVFDSEGIHDVCVRAADAANNVSTPECVDVSAEGPVGLMVKCLHEPIYPQTGEAVVIRARALDRDGNAVFADRLEIFLSDQNNQNTPFVFEGMVQVGNVNYTADDEGFIYGCRAERGNESAFSRSILVDAGEPQLSDFPAIPVLFRGGLSEKVDIVFLPDDDEYSSYLDPAFIDDVWLLISEGFGTMPSFLEQQHMFNFWIGTDSGNASPRPSNERCFRQAPDNFKSRYSFADSAGIVHRSECRDNAGSPGTFTIEMNLDRLQVVIHEAGHRPFGLADEYCCDGGYFTNSILDTPPFANLFRRENGCRNDAEDRGFDPDECRELFAAGANWWLFEPDFNDFNPQPWDWMQQKGCAGYRNLARCSLQLLPEVTGPDPDPNGLYACNELMDAYRVDTSGGAVCVWDPAENMPCLWLCRSPGTAVEAVWVPSRGVLDRYEIGPSEFDRFHWFLGQCSGGKC
jgi:ELWxxDGT repeat protein